MTDDSASKTRRRAGFAQDLAAWMVAALSCSFALTLLDVLARKRWGSASAVAHVVGAWTVIASLCLPGLVGLAVVLTGIERSRLPAWARAGVIGGLSALAIMPTARWMFSGHGIKEHPVARWAPGLVMLGCAAAGAVLQQALERSFRRQEEGRVAPGRALSLIFLSLAGVGLYVDQHFYVALYSRLHSALEVACTILLCGAAAIFGRERVLRLSRSGGLASLRGRHRPWRVALAFGLAAPFVLLSRPLLRDEVFDHLEDGLLHTYKEPVYAGRYLKRMKELRLFARDPLGWDGAQLALLGELQREYDIVDPQVDDIWTEAAPPGSEPPRGPARPSVAAPQPQAAPAETASPKAAKGAASRRPSCPDCSVLVFYVDTLRKDVAFNPRWMPHLNAFAGSSLRFDRAYAAGSSTLCSLPGLVSGLYTTRDKAPATMLEVAREHGLRRVLTIPKSANLFLKNLYPPFAFDEVMEVEDYAPDDDKVWGYGANRPSSAQLVDRTLKWIEEHPGQRFLSWIFNFEVHNWRELDDDHVARAADGLGLSKEDRRWRYWALAHETDSQLGRLMAGLERLGRMDKLIVLVISDHGEALGEWDFWVHGVVVWESVIRVPLLLRVPGLAPGAVSQPVSLIDVPPTLEGLLSEGPPGDGKAGARRHWHGMDLLETARGKPRSRPVLFVGERGDKLVRIGVLDPASPLKLVLPLETGRPELYDTAASKPDDVDIASKSPIRAARLLDIVVRSPLFPRPD